MSTQQGQSPVRRCRACGLTKPLSDFGPHPRSPGGIKSTCRHCEKLRQRLRRHGDAGYVTPQHVRVARQREAQVRGRPARRDTYRKFFGRHEHRVVAERVLGRPLREGEVVHHRDGDKHNNAAENLEVITQSQHVRRHHRQMLQARKERHGY